MTRKTNNPIENIKKLSTINLSTISDIKQETVSLDKLEKTDEEKQLARVNLIKSLDFQTDIYDNLQFTNAEVNKLRQHFTFLSSGSVSASVLICAGLQCKFHTTCPFYLMDKMPIGKPCLLEINLLTEWRRKYIEEYKIDPDSFTELTIVNELAEIETMLWRVNQSLAHSENSEFIQDNIKAVDREGGVYTEKAVSALFEVKERLSNRKAKLIKVMVGDRQEKYRMAAAMKQRDASDTSVALAVAKRELQQMIDKAKFIKSTQIVTPDDIIITDGKDKDSK